MGRKQLEKVNQRFHEWWGKRTEAELELHRLAFSFEEKYFADLRLLTSSVRRALFRCEWLVDGKWCKRESDGHPDISIEGWILKFCRFRKPIDGLCNYKYRTISIKLGLDKKARRAALLHEMIHAYMFQLDLCPEFREWLLLDLHRRLSKRMRPARLQQYINLSTHTVWLDRGHGVLFLLKSLDLDLRFKWDPGTVFAYGREEYFAGKKVRRVED